MSDGRFRRFLESVLDAIDETPLVLMGEASHGTHEYYRFRAELTLELAKRRPVRFVAVEADWPDAFRINRYVRGLDKSKHALDALQPLSRWPTWMWANHEVADFADELRRVNDARPETERVGFYGLDLYSLRESLAKIRAYLEARDGALLATAERAFECYEPGFGTTSRVPWIPKECEREVVHLLSGLQEQSKTSDGSEAQFDAESNAWAAVGAQRYYRTLLQGDGSWNVRDHHMQDTLKRLRDRHGKDAVGVVWAHNTHIGDARATDMADDGLVNLGQLARETWGAAVYALGFGSFGGSVIAARRWETQPLPMPLPPARRGSLEEALHSPGKGDQWIDLRTDRGPWDREIGHRAVGVVYHPESEAGNYVPTRLAERYDGFVFLDETRALRPIHIEPVPERTPQTVPWGE